MLKWDSHHDKLSTLLNEECPNSCMTIHNILLIPNYRINDS